jgi:acetyl esterase/lipase
MVTRREATLLGLAAIGSIRATQTAAFGAGGPSGDGGPMDPLRDVDPDLRAFLRTLPPETPINADVVTSWRQTPDLMSERDLPAGVMARTIQGSPGGKNVRIYIIGANDGKRSRPALLYMHGGGFISGSTASSWPKFSGLQKLAQEHDCLIVSVDYRLAPETPFPGALEDSYAALKWLRANAGVLGADAGRILIMGESAGGGLAATLAIAARDRGEVPIRFQLLIYPMLDDRTGSTREPAPQIGNFIWTRQSNRFGWTSLLGMPAGSPNVPYGSVPARVENLRGLPPTYLAVGALDLFVDEDIAYAGRLVDAGVPTEFYLAPGAYHGFFFLAPDAAISKKFAASFNTALAKAFASTA